MPFEVTIQPSGHKFTVEAGQTVLSAALDAGFALPYGCRNGACGACKGKVLEGEVEHGDIQPGSLSDDDRHRGLALFCSAKPKTDLVIEVKEVGAAKDITVKTLPCRIERMEKLAEDVMQIFLKLPASERLQFLPGQYIDFLLKDGKRRSFSLANAPEEDALLELHIRHVAGGEFTEHVFNTMQVKDIMRINGPLGSFFLRESDKPAILLATGTGFAPIKSMLNHAFHHESDRQFVLYWGARNLPDMYMANVASEWQQKHGNFSFIPVLSQAGGDWAGRTGYVQDAVLADFTDLSGYQVYACGSPAMIEATHKTCIGQGLPEEEFFSDAFAFQTS